MSETNSRTSILTYEKELETMKRAKRKLEYELDDDLAMHEALELLAWSYLDGDETIVDNVENAGGALDDEDNDGPSDNE